MRQVQLLPVSKLKIDLNNYRTVPQPDEVSAIKAMMSIGPGKFWGLLYSLLDFAYDETENLIVMEDGDGYIVKEGNRRTACLKIILGLVSMEAIDLPQNHRDAVRKKDNIWKKQIQEAPCIVYKPEEKAAVDRIVDRTHGKGEDASRADWESVAKARHNRANGENENGLTLLESYLVNGQNGITDAQRVRWAGDYHVTVLDEFIKKYSSRLGVATAKELVEKYPELGEHRKAVEEVIFRIGLKAVGFEEVRMDKLGTYGIPEAKPEHPAKQTETTGQAGGAGGGPEAAAAAATSADSKQEAGTEGSANPTSGSTAQSDNPAGGGNDDSADDRKTRGRNKSLPLTDPKTVKQKLRKFFPRGQGNEKTTTLVEEARHLNIEVTPFAFCFVLRSMFEIAAKVYCEKNGIATMDGKYEVKLVTLLSKALAKLSESSPAVKKELESAKREIGREDGLLSVTTLNKLTHCKVCQSSTADICVTFHQIFPLLDHMTR